MVALEIKIRAKREQTDNIKRQSRDRFVPAIRQQSGFFNAFLLEQFEDKLDIIIMLIFDSEEQRLAWVKSEEHDPAWEAIAKLSECSCARGYAIVDKAR